MDGGGGEYFDHGDIMADAQTLQDLINYYTNCLIIQYNGQPKAQATIKLMAETLLANGVMLDVRDGYNLDTAIGKQLDILGKYENIDRFYSAFDPVNYFSLETYTEAPPTTPPRYGFTDYAHYATDPPAGCILYSEIVSINNQLVDSAFRILIYLRIIQNYSDYGGGDIDSRLYALFGNSIRMEDMGNMRMVFFIDNTQQIALVEAIIGKKVFPRPMTVLGLVVSEITGPMFGLTDYRLNSSPFAYGFSTYADYASLAGLDLTYDQMAVA